MANHGYFTHFTVTPFVEGVWIFQLNGDARYAARGEALAEVIKSLLLAGLLDGDASLTTIASQVEDSGGRRL